MEGGDGDSTDAATLTHGSGGADTLPGSPELDEHNNVGEAIAIHNCHRQDHTRPAHDAETAPLSVIVPEVWEEPATTSASQSLTLLQLGVAVASPKQLEASTAATPAQLVVPTLVPRLPPALTGRLRTATAASFVVTTPDICSQLEEHVAHSQLHHANDIAEAALHTISSIQLEVMSSSLGDEPETVAGRLLLPCTDTTSAVVVTVSPSPGPLQLQDPVALFDSTRSEWTQTRNAGTTLSPTSQSFKLQVPIRPNVTTGSSISFAVPPVPSRRFTNKPFSVAATSARLYESSQAVASIAAFSLSAPTVQVSPRERSAALVSVAQVSRAQQLVAHSHGSQAQPVSIASALSDVSYWNTTASEKKRKAGIGILTSEIGSSSVSTADSKSPLTSADLFPLALDRSTNTIKLPVHSATASGTVGRQCGQRGKNSRKLEVARLSSSVRAAGSPAAGRRAEHHDVVRANLRELPVIPQLNLDKLGSETPARTGSTSTLAVNFAETLSTSDSEQAWGPSEIDFELEYLPASWQSASSPERAVPVDCNYSDIAQCNGSFLWPPSTLLLADARRHDVAVFSGIAF